MRTPSLLLGLVLVGAAGSARADGSDPAAAERLFREARSALLAGNYAVACPMFAESHRLDPAPGTVLNLADCEEKRGQLTRAWQHFRQLADELPDADERRAEAKARADALEPRIPTLRIVVATAGATVTRDGVRLGAASLGTSLPVDVGKHVVVVGARGRRDRTYELSLAEAEERTLTVSAGDPAVDGKPAQAPAAASPSTPIIVVARSDPPQRTAGWVMAGAGGGALFTGSVLGIAALANSSASNQACTGNVCADASALAQYETAQALAIATDVLLSVGAIVLGTAIALVLTTPHGSGPSLARVARSARGASW